MCLMCGRYCPMCCEDAPVKGADPALRARRYAGVEPPVSAPPPRDASTKNVAACSSLCLANLYVVVRASILVSSFLLCIRIVNSPEQHSAIISGFFALIFEKGGHSLGCDVQTASLSPSSQFPFSSRLPLSGSFWALLPLPPLPPLSPPLCSTSRLLHSVLFGAVSLDVYFHLLGILL